MKLRRSLTTVLGAAVLLAIPTTAFAHAEITPTAVDPGQEVQFTVTSVVERQALLNSRMRTIVPEGWEFVSCDLPLNWTCEVDSETYAPATLLDWQPIGTPLPGDINFAFTAVAPTDADGTYLFRTLQEHADGYTEPWVYDTEPYPAPQVTVGGVADLVNGEGSAFDPACFGPDEQPEGYDAHDGSDGSAGCTIPAAGPDQPDAGPEPAPTSEPAPEPAPSAEPSGSVGSGAPASQELPVTGPPAAVSLLGLATLAVAGTVGRRRG